MFAKADDWWVDFALKTATPNGIIGGDGKKHMIQIKRADSQSDTNRASQVAGDLVTNSKVDLMMASGSPDTANPVADQCEALGCPSIANFVPWQPFYFGRGATPDKPFKWTYAQALGLEQIVANFITIWDQVQTNKKVGFLFANDSDGSCLDRQEHRAAAGGPESRLHLLPVRPLSGRAGGLHQVHLRLQEERMRDLLRHHHHS